MGNEPGTTGFSFSRPRGAEQRGDRGAAADQMAPEAASGGHPGVLTLTFTNTHALFFFFLRSMAPLVAYGGSQARDRI